MTASIARRLALKDIYMARWTLTASVAAGLASIAIGPLGVTAFYVGSVSFVCVLIILNIFVVMSGVFQEKQDGVLVFLLSLPISTAQYWVLKMATNFTMFAVPWLLLTAASLATIAATAIPDGMIPFVLAIAGYIFCYYCLLLGVAITTGSLFWTTTVIVAGNISVNFFIPLVFRLPSARAVSGDAILWGRDIVTTLAAEAAFCIAALAVSAAVQSRKRDFV